MDEDKDVDEKVEDQKVDKKGDGEDESPTIDEMAGIDLDADLHKENEEEEKVEETAKEEEKKPPEPTTKEKETEARLARLENDKRDLQKALHEARQERKKSKEPEVVFTRAQIKELMKEHKDDPDVLENIIEYKIQQGVKTGKNEAINEVEIKNRKQQLDGILRDRVKTFDDENSEPRGFINRAKTDFNLEDHPYGDFLGAAAAVYMNLQAILDERFEQGKKASLGDKAEESRKKGIKESQASPGGPKLPTGRVSRELTASQMETAKKLGFNTPEKIKLYKTQILKVAPTNA